MKIDYKKIRNVAITTSLFAGIVVGCEYCARLENKGIPSPSEILPSEVTLNSDGHMYVDEKGFGFNANDANHRCRVIFRDDGCNGSLDDVIVINAVGEDTLTNSSPYFSEWNEKFLEMRERRFGE